MRVPEVTAGVPDVDELALLHFFEQQYPVGCEFFRSLGVVTVLLRRDLEPPPELQEGLGEDPSLPSELPIRIRGSLPRNDRGQVRGALRSHEPLQHGEPRDAHASDTAGRPLLHTRPLDDVVEAVHLFGSE